LGGVLKTSFDNSQPLFATTRTQASICGIKPAANMPNTVRPALVEVLTNVDTQLSE
jgi:hypothetical protein